MFLQACVILFTGGVSASMHSGIHTPRSRHPQSRHPPEQTPAGADTPWEQTPPAAEHAGRYGQRAGGTHSTGMQSCWVYVYIEIRGTYFCDTVVQCRQGHNDFTVKMFKVFNWNFKIPTITGLGHIAHFVTSSGFKVGHTLGAPLKD